jgi:hypothetical protein
MFPDLGAGSGKEFPARTNGQETPIGRRANAR